MAHGRGCQCNSCFFKPEYFWDTQEGRHINKTGDYPDEQRRGSGVVTGLLGREHSRRCECAMCSFGGSGSPRFVDEE